MLGVALMVGSFLFYMTQVLALEQEIMVAQLELDKIKNKPAVLAVQTTPAQTSAHEVSEFYKIFPKGASLPQWLSLIDQSALKQHLVLNRGDYKLSESKQGQLLRYEIVLPVVGKYTQIRQFIADVMQKSPALALSDMQIKRESTTSPTVEARLVLVLFLQASTW